MRNDGQAAFCGKDANRLASLYPRQRTREVSLLLRLRIAAPTQLRLVADDDYVGNQWQDLPAATQAVVLAQLAHLIAKGVVEEGDDG